MPTDTMRSNGIVYMGARSEPELLDRFAQCVEMLDLRVTNGSDHGRPVRAHPEKMVEPSVATEAAGQHAVA